MEQRACADSIALLNQGDAAFADNFFEILDGLEIGVGERLVDKLPKVLGRLQLGTVGGLEDEADAVGHGQIFGTVPTRAVELQHDAFVCACARRFGKVSKDGLEHFFANGVGDVPHRGSAGRFDKAPDIKPLVTVMAKRNGPLAFRRPYSSQDRLQADPMLVHRPELDACVRMLLLLFSGNVLQFFLTRRDPPRPPLRDGAASVFELNIR